MHGFVSKINSCWSSCVHDNISHTRNSLSNGKLTPDRAKGLLTKSCVIRSSDLASVDRYGMIVCLLCVFLLLSLCLSVVYSEYLSICQLCLSDSVCMSVSLSLSVCLYYCHVQRLAMTDPSSYCIYATVGHIQEISLLFSNMALYWSLTFQQQSRM